MSTGANDAATPGIAQHDRLAQRNARHAGRCLKQ